MPSIINATLSNGLVTSADNSGSLQLQTNNGTTAVTIDTSQNVGIGTSSPSQKLHVAAGTGNGIQISSDGSTAGATLFLQQTQTSNYTWRMAVGGGDNAWVSGRGWFLRDDNAGATRLVVNTSGFVGINNNSPSWLLTASNTGTSPRIAVEQTADTSCDMITFRRNNSERGKINVTDSATQYQTSSDYRLKENIKPLTNALETVAKLKPSSFTWIQERGGKEDNGFIAHELQEVLPNAVTGEKDAVDEEGNPVYQGVDTSFLVATLTAALQEAHGLIKDLQARVETLEAK